MSDCLQNEDSIVSDLSLSNSDTLTGILDSGNNVNSEISIEETMVSSVSDGDSTDSNLGDDGSLYSELSSGGSGGIKYTGQETDSIVVTVDNNVYTISASLRPIKFDSVADFPQVGSEKLIYVDFSNKTLYGWDSTKSVYYKLVADVKVPTKLSEFTNDAGFITNTVNNLVEYYKKTETYSQAEIDSKISAIPKFDIKVVAELPTTDISETTVYLVASEGDDQNLYVEYIYVGGAWEKLGEQKLDLSGYVTTDALNTELSKYYTKSNVDSLLNSKADKTELPNVSNFITKDVDNLTNYHKKSETYTKTETDNLLDAGLSTKANKTDLNNYVTNTELEQKGYLTEVPDNYATKSDVQTSVSSLDSEFRTLLNNKADVSVVEELDNEIGNVAYNLSTVKNQYLKAVAVTNDGKTLTISDQDNKQIFFESGGTEYTAGAGIGISNGVISSLFKGVLCRKLAVEQSISSSYVNLIFGTNLFTYGNVSYNSSNEIVIGKDVSAIKFTLTSAFYNMSKEGYSTVRIYKNGSNIGEELWFSYQSGISGGGACSIVVPCSEGDKFKFGMRVVSGHTGYVNNNTFVVAEVM